MQIPHKALVLIVYRCDLGIALLANSDPVFYRSPVDPLPDYPAQVISSLSSSLYSQNDLHLFQDLNKPLVEAWVFMKKFCSLANLGTQTRMLIEPATIYGSMIAIMYRLLRMGFAENTLEESLRLGLLAFSQHVFLQWRDMRLPDHPFSMSYRNHLRSYSLGNMIPPRISLWLLMIGAVSFFNIPDELWLVDCLRKQTERCGVKTWKDGQENLKSSMWISLLDDDFGKQVFETLNKMPGVL
jgi:hypothetical protein